jgi:two-component system, chemotaxis family, protein-glutamate methylesterase/glutaminase
MAAVRDIIVIGASLGGLEALCKLTSGLPANLEASVMIVLHTSPDSPRLLADIVGRCTTLAVSYARQGDAVERRHVYFAPPDYHLTVTPSGYLCLDQGPKEQFHRPAADALFRSAAKAWGPRVIGVVLTGGGEDGTEGLRAIKVAAGLTVVQEPSEAIASSMPLTALRRDHQDHQVSLGEMASLLTQLVEGR